MGRVTLCADSRNGKGFLRVRAEAQLCRGLGRRRAQDIRGRKTGGRKIGENRRAARVPERVYLYG